MSKAQYTRCSSVEEYFGRKPTAEEFSLTELSLNYLFVRDQKMVNVGIAFMAVLCRENLNTANLNIFLENRRLEVKCSGGRT